MQPIVSTTAVYYDIYSNKLRLLLIYVISLVVAFTGFVLVSTTF